MNSKVLKLNRNLIPEIKSRLKAGEVIILPTDTVYALVANGNDTKAVTLLRQIKAFSSPQPLGVFTRKEKAEQVVKVDRAALQMMNHFPYPVTMIMRAKPTLSEAVTNGFKNVFVTCPDRFIYDLVMEIPFPMVGTSAAFAGIQATDAELAVKFYGDKVSLIIDGGKSKHGRSGTLLDFTVEVPTIMTYGTVSLDDLRPLLPQIILPSHMMK
ncbi:RNA-binding protein [Pleurocapsa sp. CCALA 161]|uniref:L-threonylcarbamoyladenylate synthase n=1 Tax=Pleurocapsa sp. CCALA 161 TaxID=2107688 RepID=UPI000D073305|nr:L-threonylcarbamoyladenylate synthase [Pleurocapsa sp. CCALA 161]PSB11680.1 RNA-binding protein [Pleurocapsa sp. CCALA 161]